MDLIGAVNASIAQLAARIRRLEALPRGHIPPDAVMFDHFAGDGTLDARWTTALTGTGTVTLPNAAPTYVRLDSGATAGGIGRLSWGTAGSRLVGMAASTWLRARFRIPTGIDASGEADLGLLDTPATFANYILLGWRGPSSAVNWVVSHQAGGAGALFADTGIAIDMAWHELLIQTMPAAVRVFLDDAFINEYTTEIPLGVTLQPHAVAYNGATNASRQLDIDWLAVDEAAV